MQPFSLEQSIIDLNNQVKELFTIGDKIVNNQV